MNQETPQRTKELYGLVECPLLKGYIEFSYKPGDRVSNLKGKILANWGGEAIKLDPRDSKYSVYGIEHWTLFYEDAAGALVQIFDHEDIPVMTPQQSQQSRPTKMRNRIKHITGIVFLRDILKKRRRKKQIMFQLPERSQPTEYKQYSVKLIALVAVEGG